VSASLFLVDAVPSGEILTLDGAEGRHAATVARLRTGERLLVGDGRGTTATAVVTAVGKASLDLRIETRGYAAPAEPRLVVVQGIAKADRGELAVQAMTEAGVDAVVPWAASRSVARWRDEGGGRPHQRWVDTAREAAKQARRSWLPVIAPPESTAAVCARLAASAAAVVLHEEAVRPMSTVELPSSGEVTLVVGPEGGIAPEELAAFDAAGAVVARLGATVLRTSTAGVAALAVLNARLGRW
jgi:16S rRNA (uracil1498-N3)-methyltransferase